MEDERRGQTIYIGGFSSRCGNCGKNAFPDQGSHIDVRFDSKEYAIHNLITDAMEIVPEAEGIPGCGAVWKYMVCDYPDQKENCERKWPQYEYI